MTYRQETLWYVLPVTVKSIENDGAASLDVGRCPDLLQQILERASRLDTHQQDVAFLAGHRVARLDLRDVYQAGGRIIGLRRIKRSNGHERRQQMPDRLRVDARGISRHHAASLQPAHPRLDR